MIHTNKFSFMFIRHYEHRLLPEYVNMEISYESNNSKFIFSSIRLLIKKYINLKIFVKDSIREDIKKYIDTLKQHNSTSVVIVPYDPTIESLFDGFVNDLTDVLEKNDSKFINAIFTRNGEFVSTIKRNE